MKLINTDGMVLIGPGSEWLWTMISGIVLAITFIAIYRQLRMQRSAAAIEQLALLKRENYDERMCRSRLACLLALKDGVDPKNLPPAVFDVQDFWERVGYLARAGHIDRGLINQYLGDNLQIWWGWLAPSTYAERQTDQNPQAGANAKWLAGVMADYNQQAGRPATYDDAYRARMLPIFIENNLRLIHTLEELRAVIVRPLSSATLAPDTRPAPNLRLP